MCTESRTPAAQAFINFLGRVPDEWTPVAIETLRRLNGEEMVFEINPDDVRVIEEEAPPVRPMAMPEALFPNGPPPQHDLSALMARPAPANQSAAKVLSAAVIAMAVLGGFLISELRHRTVASARAARPISAPVCPAVPQPIVTPIQMVAAPAPACPAPTPPPKAKLKKKSRRKALTSVKELPPPASIDQMIDENSVRLFNIYE